MLDERWVRRGSDGDGLLDQAVEQLSAMAYGAAVEPEREFVQVVVQMGPRHRPLMRAEQPPFQQRNDLMHPREQLRRRCLAALHKRDPVPVAVLLQSVVTEQPVG